MEKTKNTITMTSEEALNQDLFSINILSSKVLKVQELIIKGKYYIGVLIIADNIEVELTQYSYLKSEDGFYWIIDRVIDKHTFLITTIYPTPYKSFDFKKLSVRIIWKDYFSTHH
jgi:hypothetical protein